MDDSLKRYLEFFVRRPELFETPSGGVRILTDPDAIRDVEQTMARSLEEKGLPGAWSRVGMTHEDQYITVLRDAVVFPGGRVGTYNRIIHNNGDPSGVAVLPVLDGRIVMLRHFRHATRRYHFEAPRGGIEPGQTPEDAAVAELREELGGVARSLVPLGPLHEASNLINSAMMLMFAELVEVGDPAVDEGIEAIHHFEIGAFEQLLREGGVTDAFTIGAFAQARLRGLV